MGKALLNSFFTLIFCAGAVVAATDTAHAECPDGRVASEATQGRCCWPGQGYDLTNSVCTGAPACPAGLVAQGDDCIASAQTGGGIQIMEHGTGGTATVQPAPQTVPVQQAPAAYQPVPVTAPLQQQPVTYVSRPRTGMIVGGSIMFGVSYLIAILTAVGAEDGLWAVPVVGPFAQMANVNEFDDLSGYAYAGLTLWGIVQAAGLTLLTLGIVLRREVPVRAGLDLDGQPGGLALNPLMNIDENGATGGLSLVGDF